MNSSIISCNRCATWLSRMYSIFLPRNSDRSNLVTVLLRVHWVSQWLWDHPVETDHRPNYKGVGYVSYLPPLRVNICVFLLSVSPHFIYASTTTIIVTSTTNLNCQRPASKWPIKCLDFSQNDMAKNYLPELAGLLICEWWFLSIRWHLGAPITR